MSEMKKKTLKKLGKLILVVFVMGGIIIENSFLFSKFGGDGILFNSPFIAIEVLTLGFILLV